MDSGLWGRVGLLRAAIHVLSGFLLEQQHECTCSPCPKAFPAHRMGGKWAKAEKGCVTVPKLYLWEGVREKNDMRWQ